MAEDAEWFSRPADNRCHHCGKVFTYRIDKYNHVVNVHDDKSGKRPDDDRPAWDTTSQSDLWGTRQIEGHPSAVREVKIWDDAPTPAEASLLQQVEDEEGMARKRNKRQSPRKQAWSPLDRPEPSLQTDDDDCHEGPDRNHSAFDILTFPKLTSSPAKSVQPEAPPSSSDDSTISCSTASSTAQERKAQAGASRPDPIANLPISKLSYQCRVCKDRFETHEELHHHIYKREHHDPISAHGYLINEERLQRRRQRDMPHEEPLDYGDDNAPADATSALDETEQCTSDSAARDDHLEEEEDLIDFDSIAEPDTCEQHPSTKAQQSRRQLAVRSFHSGDAATTADPLGDNEDFFSENYPTMKPTSQSIQPDKEHDSPASARPTSSTPSPPSTHTRATSRSTLNSEAASFKPSLKAFAPTFLPSRPVSTGKQTPTPPSKMLNPSAQQFTFMADAHVPAHTFTALQNAGAYCPPQPDPGPLYNYQTNNIVTSISPVSPSPPAAPNELPHPKTPCWAGCTAKFPAMSLVIHHLETQSCLPFFARLKTQDLYKTAAETTCAHDFIDGRYLRDMSMKRNLVEKYKGNAYPFVCPNEEACGMVFTQMFALWVHFEKSECMRDMHRVASVKGQVESALEGMVVHMIGGAIGSGWD